MQIREHADATPDKPAVIIHPAGTVVTFKELEARANRLAHHFRQAGLVEGDTVAVIMENNEHLHAVMWAARRSGLYYTVVSTHLTPPEVGYIVDDDLEGWQRYPECVADQPSTPIDDEIEGDLLQYSSGTTGRPKGIRRELAHVAPAQAPNLVSALLMAIQMSPDSIYLSPAPLYHTAPCLWTMSAQAMGVTTVVMSKFDPESALDAIQKYRVTSGQFVPAMFVRMLKLPEDVRNSYDISTLHRVVHAAAPCPVDIKKQMIAWWGPVVDEYYSSSEGAGITFISADEWLKRPGSVGKPLLGVAHILDENGNDLPHGQAGQIYFDLGVVQFVYHKDPEKTAESRDRHGWVTVGDVGYLDDDGFLFLTDRKHHMIISGGVNIYPQEA